MKSVLIDKEPFSLDYSSNGTSVAVCGNNLLNVYDFSSGSFKLQLSSSYDQKRRITYQDISWSKVDSSLLALGTSTTHVQIKSFAPGRLAPIRNYDNIVERSVSSLSFHPSDSNLLLVSARDEIVLLDIRMPDAFMKHKYPNSVQKVSWNPHKNTVFAACMESWIEVIDLAIQSSSANPMKTDQFVGHRGPVFCCDWHPSKRDTLASGGRDCYIKVWNITESRHSQHSIKFFLPVDCIKWRPSSNEHIVSAASTFDQNILCWNINRPYLPSHSFGGHSRKVSKFCFYDKNVDAFLSIGGDKTLRHHSFDNAVIPETCTVPNNVKFTSFESLCDVEVSSKKYLSANSVILDVRINAQRETTNPFEFCLQNYALNQNEPVVSCELNSQVAKSCRLHNVAETWKLLAKLFPKSQRSISKSRNASANTEKNVQGQKMRPVDTKQAVYIKPPEWHNFSETSTESSEIEFGVSKLQKESTKSVVVNSPIAQEPYNTQHELKEKNVLTVSHDEDSQTEMDEDDDEGQNSTSRLKLVHVLKSAPITVRAENSQNGTQSNSLVPFAVPFLGQKFSMKFLFSLLKDMIERLGQLQFAVSALIILQNELKFPDCSSSDVFGEGEMLLSFKDWLLSYHNLLSCQGLYVEACDVSVRFPITSLRDKIGKFERVHLKKHCDEKCKSGCDVCIDRIIDRHSNTQMKLRSTCCKSSFINRRCSKCLKCAKCTYCKQPVKSLFAWCQGCGHGGHLHHMEAYFRDNSVCLVPSCGHKCEFS